MKVIDGMLFFDDWNDYNKNRSTVYKMRRDAQFTKKDIETALLYIIGQLEPANSGNVHSSARNDLKRKQWARAKELEFWFPLYKGQQNDNKSS